MTVHLIGVAARVCIPLAAATLMVGIDGCGRKAGAAPGATIHAPESRPATTTADTQPATAAQPSYLNKQAGVRIHYPSDWAPQPSKDCTFLLVPVSAKSSVPSISLDIPALPPHLPMMVRMGSVEGGYIDDLKKTAPDTQILEKTTPTLPKADAKRIHSKFEVAGQSHTKDAVLIIHAGQVYILEMESATEDYDHLRPVFDGIFDSLQWTQ